jgi:hypothetical protein
MIIKTMSFRSRKKEIAAFREALNCYDYVMSVIVERTGIWRICRVKIPGNTEVLSETPLLMSLLQPKTEEDLD